MYSSLQKNKSATSRPSSNPPNQPPKPAAKPTDTSTDTTKEIAAIAALRKAKLDRAERLAKAQNLMQSQIIELRRSLWKLQIELKSLQEIAKAEKAEQDAANSWTSWVLSPIVRKPFENSEDKAWKDRERLQRFYSRSMKEVEITRKEATLKACELSLKSKRQEFEDENSIDEVLQARWERELLKKENLI